MTIIRIIVNMCILSFCVYEDMLRSGGAHLAAERSPSAARADGAMRSVAVPNGEGEASGSAT